MGERVNLEFCERQNIFQNQSQNKALFQKQKSKPICTLADLYLRNTGARSIGIRMEIQNFPRVESMQVVSMQINIKVFFNFNLFKGQLTA